MNQKKRIKQHFDEEAPIFDELIPKVIPCYIELIEAIVSAIPYNPDEKFSMIDLGSGTGTIAKAVQDKFPNVQITCMDMSEKMLDVCKQKFDVSIHCLHESFETFEFPQKYDVIVSSMSLHHLQDLSAYQIFYKKIYNALNSKGHFVNADIVLGTNEKIQKLYMEKWIAHMEKSFSKNEIETTWLANYYAEDRPISLMEHLKQLKNSGFETQDVLYKHYNFVTYLAEK